MILFTAVAGTWQYMAPELSDRRAGTAKVDLYALGLIINEMLTGQRWSFDNQVQRIQAIKQGWLPYLDPETPDHMKKLIRRLLKVDPRDRPDAGQAVRRLERMIQIEIERIAGILETLRTAGKEPRDDEEPRTCGLKWCR